MLLTVSSELHTVTPKVIGTTLWLSFNFSHSNHTGVEVCSIKFLVFGRTNP